jgi:hypothetical protein
VEKALPIVCQPQAVFRIRPVSRCSATISGMKDMINFILSLMLDVARGIFILKNVLLLYAKSRKKATWFGFARF